MATNKPDHANNDHQDDSQHDRIFRDVLTMIVRPNLNGKFEQVDNGGVAGSETSFSRWADPRGWTLFCLRGFGTSGAPVKTLILAGQDIGSNKIVNFATLWANDLGIVLRDLVQEGREHLCPSDLDSSKARNIQPQSTHTKWWKLKALPRPCSQQSLASGMLHI